MKMFENSGHMSVYSTGMGHKTPWYPIVFISIHFLSSWSFVVSLSNYITKLRFTYA